MTTSAFKDRLRMALNAESDRRLASGKRRLIQTDVWRAVGVSSGAMSHWLKGTNAADMAQCVKLAQFLGCDALWLFDGSDPASSKGAAHQPAHQPDQDPFIVAILADLAKARSPDERQTLERHLLAESSKWLLERQDKSVAAKPLPKPDPKAQASS